MVLGSNPVAVTSPSDFAPASSKGFLDIQATIERGFTLKSVRDMTEYTVKCTIQISAQNTVQSFKASLAKWLSVLLLFSQKSPS